jgi:AcrR family transcriptional regulator
VVDELAHDSPARATTPAQRQRRNRIVSAASDMLTDTSYDEIQIKDVAARAELALGTLYRYFPSKEQLFAHALLEWSSRFEEAVSRRSPSGDSDPERLRTTLERAARAFERSPNFFQLITVLEVSRDPEVVRSFATFSNSFSAALSDSLRETDPDDRDAVVDVLVALFGSLMRGWWLGRISVREVHDRTDRAIALLYRGADEA